MKFLLYGHNGWIAKHIANIILSSGNALINGSRVTCISDAWDDIAQHAPDRIICALGRTNGPGFNTIDYLEQEGTLTENMLANLTAPILISQAAGAIPVLYIGSGCIFEHDTVHINHPFEEDDLPNFFGSSYSIVKGQTDEIHRALNSTLCARIRMPITQLSEPRDFITKISRYSKIVSIPNSMTILADILPLLVACIEHSITGTFNAVNQGYIDHQQILDYYNQLLGGSIRFVLTTEREMSGLILSRRSNNILSSAMLDQQVDRLPPQLRVKYNIQGKAKPLKEGILQILRSRNIGSLERGNRVILVTGGAGFIASNWINYWSKQHPLDRIVNVDNLGRNSNLQNILVPESTTYKFVKGDLIDYELVKSLFQEEAFSHVIHFAALSNVDHSFASPLECTQANVLATHVLLEVARQFGQLSLFVFISTDEVYGELAEGTFSESNTRYQPTSPYSASKAAAECLVKAYGKAYNLPYIITRSNNVYGPNQAVVNAMPKFTSMIAKHQRMPVHGNGVAVRRFVHVLDKCRAIEILLEKGRIGEAYNIGTSRDVKVIELCSILLKAIVGDADDLCDWVDFVPDRVYNDCRYAVDTSKIEALGWKAEIDFECGIRAASEWYLNKLRQSEDFLFN